MDFEFRELTKNDIHEVSKIYIVAYAKGIWDEFWTHDLAQQRILEMFLSPQYRSYVAISDRNIIGCIICEILTWHTGKQMEVKEIFVLPKYQKMGVGKKLISCMKEVVKEKGVTEVFLWTKNGQSLIDFYTDIGFKVNNDVVQFNKSEMEELK